MSTSETARETGYGGVDDGDVIWGPPPTGPCRKEDHPLTVHGRDTLTGEQYVQCPCGADREYIEGTGKNE